MRTVLSSIIPKRRGQATTYLGTPTWVQAAAITTNVSALYYVFLDVGENDIFPYLIFSPYFQRERKKKRVIWKAPLEGRKEWEGRAIRNSRWVAAAAGLYAFWWIKLFPDVKLQPKTGPPSSSSSSSNHVKNGEIYDSLRGEASCCYYMYIPQKRNLLQHYQRICIAEKDDEKKLWAKRVPAKW